MAKYYTTIEQSKKLVELSIDTNTADMHYFTNIKIPGVLSYSQMLEHFKKKQSELNDSCINANVPYLIPCWSTEALLKLLPRNINHLFVLDDIFVFPANGYRLLYRNVRKYTDNERIITYSNDTLLNCAFEMIVKLKELKLL